MKLLGEWFGGLARGDAGRSWISGAEVTPAVVQALGASLLLMAAALLVAAATAAAVCARTLRLGAHRRLDDRRGGGSAAAMLAALPEFLTGSVLAVAVGVHLGWLPALGWYGPRWTVLPALALGLPAGALLGRMLDDLLPGAFAEPWALAAAARGIPGRATARQAVRRCIPGLLPNIGLFVVGLTGGAVTVEQIFDIPGSAAPPSRPPSPRTSPSSRPAPSPSSCWPPSPEPSPASPPASSSARPSATARCTPCTARARRRHAAPPSSTAPSCSRSSGSA